MGVAPRYREIADELRDAILSEGELAKVRLVSDAKLPTEPELATHFGVGRGTVRQALQSLMIEGLVETRGRAGTFVRRLPVLVHSAHAEHPDRAGTADTWHDEVTRSGRTPSQDFAFRIVPASNGVAQRLHVEVDVLVVVRECLRYVDGMAWSEQTSYYPLDVAQAAGLDAPHDIQEGTVRRMSDRGFREIGWTDEVSCRPATAEESRTFSVSPDASMLVYNRVGWTDQRPVRLSREILPADRNVVRYELGDMRGRRVWRQQRGSAEA